VTREESGECGAALLGEEHLNIMLVKNIWDHMIVMVLLFIALNSTGLGLGGHTMPTEHGVQQP